MIDQEILDRAIQTALGDEDLVEALAGLELDESELKSQLNEAVSNQSDEIESAASAELQEWTTARDAVAAAEQTAIDVAVASSPELSEAVGRLRAEIAALQTVIDRRSAEEAQERARLEAYRTEKEILKARAAAGRLGEEAAKPRRRVRLRPSSTLDPVEARELEYMRQVEELQNRKKSIADAVTGRMRLELQLAKYKSIAAKQALGSEAVTPEFEAAKIRAQAAQSRLERALVQRGILPVLRRWANERIQRKRQNRYRLDLTGATASGLSELPNPDQRIDTEGQDRLERILRQLPGGTIGISGPRGAGKTTMIRAFCGPDRAAGAQRLARFAILVSAPVKFAPLEFVMHVFEQACRTVLPPGTPVDPLLRPADDRHAEKLRKFRLVANVAILLGCFLVILGAVLAAKGVGNAAVTQTTRYLILAGAIASASLLSVSFLSLRADIPNVVPVIGVPFATLIVMATSNLGAWSFVEWLVVGITALTGAGIAFLGSDVAVSPAAHLWTSSWVAGLLIAALVLVAAVIGHHVNHTFIVGVGVMALLIVAVPAALRAAQRRPTPWDQMYSYGEGGDRHAFDADLAVLGQSALYDGVWSMGFVLLALVFGLMALGWFHHTASITVVVGVILAVAGAITVTQARRARQVLEYERRRGSHFQANPAVDEPRHWRAADGPPAPHEGSWPGVSDRRDRPGAHRRMVGSERPATESEVGRPDALTVLARDCLTRIKYQRGYSADWSRKLALGGVGGFSTLPVSAEASASGGQSSTEYPITLPEAVALLREYLSNAAELAGGFMIGIDELDKISVPEDAERFLNEIKAIFGIPLCYFLISISEDAVASFERRGMPFRDVLDSAFDDVVRIGYFYFRDTEALLNGRTLDMPVPFMALCHSLSGGLPRDLIRMARRLFELHDVAHTNGLSELATSLTVSELQAKRDGTVTTLRRLGVAGDPAVVLQWLTRPTALRPTLASLLTAPPQLSDGGTNEVTRTINRLAREYAAYWYLSATVVDFFSDARDPADYESAERGGGEGSFDQLARARQAFGIDSELVWDRVSSFRRAWELVVPTAGQFNVFGGDGGLAAVPEDYSPDDGA